MTPTPLLDQGNALFAAGAPLTLAQVKQLDALCEQAIGPEAEYLGDLWSAALLHCTPEALDFMTTLEDDA